MVLFVQRVNGYLNGTVVELSARNLSRVNRIILAGFPKPSCCVSLAVSVLFQSNVFIDNRSGF